MGIRLTCFERRVLDVVLAGVLVDEGVDRLCVGVRVVDLHEWFPLVRQGVLGEDRFDRALGLAGAAVDALLGVDVPPSVGSSRAIPKVSLTLCRPSTMRSISSGIV